MIQTVHAQVAGRARYKVEGLRYSQPLKRLFEYRLALQKDIQSVSASTVTGNLLVNFNSNSSQKSVAFLLEGVLDEFQNGAPVIDDQFQEYSASSKESASVKKGPPSRPLTNETIKRFLAPATGTIETLAHPRSGCGDAPDAQRPQAWFSPKNSRKQAE